MVTSHVHTFAVMQLALAGVGSSRRASQLREELPDDVKGALQTRINGVQVRPSDTANNSRRQSLHGILNKVYLRRFRWRSCVNMYFLHCHQPPLH
jgi:hypothetical protein